MNASSPQYELFSESSGNGEPGGWRFVLRACDGSEQFEAADVEPDAQGDRLELLTVLRGLEALGQPARVTLRTASVHVREGIRHGLREWRRNGWQWEFFGHMVPVKNRDLWQRVDCAMQFHSVECRTWRFDPPHQSVKTAVCGSGDLATIRIGGQWRLCKRLARAMVVCRRWIVGGIRKWSRSAARAGTTLAACP